MSTRTEQQCWMRATLLRWGPLSGMTDSCRSVYLQGRPRFLEWVQLFFFPCPYGRVIPPLHETSCVALVALVQRDVPRNKCCRSRESQCDSCRDLPDEGCLWKGSACLQSDNLSFWKYALVLAGKIWIHWSTPLSGWKSIYQLWLFKSFLSWFWALCCVLKRSSAWCIRWKQ